MVPHAATILTALLKEHFDLTVLDANGGNLDEENCKSLLKTLDPVAVLVSGLSVEYQMQYHSALALAKETCPQAKTVLGGVYPTVLGEEALKDPNVDFIFLGHAENRVVEFLNYILKGDGRNVVNLPGIGFVDSLGNQVINPVNTYIGDVKQAVKPDYSLLDMAPYIIQDTMAYQFNSNRPAAPIITSYGCLYNCVFCATRTISGRRVLYRPVDHVLEEVAFLVKELGVRELLFLDDALLGNRKRIIALLKALIDSNYDLTWKAATVAAWHLDNGLLELMKQSGCVQITVSVESGSPRVLKEVIRKPLKLEIVPPIVKKCRELGIACGANFVIGFPGETWDEIRDTFRFAESCDFDVAHFHIATPLPKTDLYRIAMEQNLLPEDFGFTDPRFFGFGRGFITTTEFTPFELAVLRSFEWDRINFSTPEKVARMARLYGVTEEELTKHRRETRRKLGIHF
jgi:anaerobic magnesium-protoporphyrin IX monomethyl ester cyclase